MDWQLAWTIVATLFLYRVVENTAVFLGVMVAAFFKK